MSTPMTSEQSAPVHLFTPWTLRGITLRNRVAVSPMCQYSSVDGLANEWHKIHLGSRAVGGAGLVIVEATGVEARGRITPADMGLWKDEQIAPLAEIAAFLKQQGAVPGIQLAHAGRKASHSTPWEGDRMLTTEQGGWQTVAPSAIGFRPTDPAPHTLTPVEIAGIVQQFVDSTHRALRAGFEVIEIHAAHGYLLHEFLSPLSNHRTDEYGGSLPNRMRFVLEVARAMRAAMPQELPLFVRLSCTDWVEGGWNIDESVELSCELKTIGVDLIDCSSGAIVPDVKIPIGPGFQVPFAARIRREASIATGAVGMITEPGQANDIITKGEADLVLIARELLRDPYWPLHAARALGQKVAAPVQYGRAL